MIPRMTHDPHSILRSDLLEAFSASSDEADMFRDLHQSYCGLHRILGERERAEIARRLTVLVSLGIRSRTRLLAGLDANREEDDRRLLFKATHQGRAAKE